MRLNYVRLNSAVADDAGSRAAHRNQRCTGPALQGPDLKPVRRHDDSHALRSDVMDLTVMPADFPAIDANIIEDMVRHATQHSGGATVFSPVPVNVQDTHVFALKKVVRNGCVLRQSWQM